MRRYAILLLFALVAVSGVQAQESTSFQLTDTVFNQGGSPQEGSGLLSASYRIDLSSLGDALGQLTLSGPSFLLDGGIVSSLRPPGEVDLLLFNDAMTLAWTPGRSSGTYSLFRDDLALVGGAAACLEDGVLPTTYIDTDSPTLGAGYLYLVASANRLGEVGSLGSDSAGAERSGSAVCP